MFAFKWPGSLWTWRGQAQRQKSGWSPKLHPLIISRVGSANPNIVSEYELTPTETQSYLQTVEKQEKEHWKKKKKCVFFFFWKWTELSDCWYSHQCEKCCIKQDSGHLLSWILPSHRQSQHSSPPSVRKLHGDRDQERLFGEKRSSSG